MSNYQSHLAQDRRLCMLRLLKESGGTANESVLQNGLELLGHRRLPRATIREDIRFLINQGLIIDEWFGDVQVCTITRRGVECAEGIIQVEGIKKPSIGV